MPVANERNLEEEVIAVLKAISGVKVITADQMVGRDVGIYGLDGIEVVEELEKKFEIDLRPLIDSHTISRRRTWIDRVLGQGHPYADVTVRTLVNYIAGELQRKADGQGEPPP